MRIIRNHDHDDHEDDDHDKDRESRDPKALGDILADEISDFLAEAACAGAPFPIGQDAPTEPAAPRPVKPVLRLVKSDDTQDYSPSPAADGRLRPRLLRAGLGGSLAVLAAVVFAGWGQPAAVVIPLAAYGLGWIAYLWWNAAWRPPIPQVLAVIATAISRGIAATVRGICHATRRTITRLETVRTRHETHRTTA
ncbi:hypothetical protein FOH10_29490 [Nocardia otitidiscaviarum]|uniref:Uncharacterized protein n=1 Tax=Nocardia otitidiscaviarum TaxID=1823 RepID=A0A516NTN2_9NOCA|nr:hypothetical protein [Nocardia otitidiscaviarum]MCP9621587.1 hypothetical protein [Nocardia otitidiscaviarum]QDP82253.1 hypothetical protein FOH10_29490 [Nocardia otitidiscaviarum]